ncbi:PAS domain S-box protein [Sphingomonadaceae bacterium OTU29LAMAA1]|nr:PAS domain S-box protein [Sphingomonadaceae bacterium OTU29LAMAA1]
MHPASGPIAHGLIGRNLEVVDVDGAYAGLLGLTRDQIIGRPALDFTYPDDRAAAALFIGRVWRETQTMSATQRHIHADGHAIWVNVHISRIGTGNDRRLVVTCRPLPRSTAPSTVEAQWRMARLLLQAMEGGKRAFGDALIGNPATEILLLSYVAEAEAATAQAGDIALRIGVTWPLTRRWLLALADAGFIETEVPGAIGPTTPIRLTPRALALIEAIFGALISVVRDSLVPA